MKKGGNGESESIHGICKGYCCKNDGRAKKPESSLFSEPIESCKNEDAGYSLVY